MNGTTDPDLYNRLIAEEARSIPPAQQTHSKAAQALRQGGGAPPPQVRVLWHFALVPWGSVLTDLDINLSYNGTVLDRPHFDMVIGDTAKEYFPDPFACALPRRAPGPAGCVRAPMSRGGLFPAAGAFSPAGN